MNNQAGAHADQAPQLWGPAFDADPADAYRWLRQNAPVYRLHFSPEVWAWLVTRYDDVHTALSDPRLVKGLENASPAFQRSGMGLPLDNRPSLAQHMNNADGVRHRYLRRLASRMFTPHRLATLQQRIEQITEHLLDQMEKRQQVDIIADLALPLSITIICQEVGVPEEDRAELKKWAAVFDSSDGSNELDLLSVTNAFDEYLTDLVVRKRIAPGDDLISELVHQLDEGKVTREEITSNAFLLLIAGHETITALIGNSVLATIADDERLVAARAQHDVIVHIVEESLRRDSPVRNATWRFPREPVRIGGQLLQPGEAVLLSLLAANRDPMRYPEPDTFVPGRDIRGHVAFGHGPHACPGSGLARMQAITALSGLLRRFTTIDLAIPADQLRWWPSPILRGLYALPLVVKK